jgi:opacity protein-like surface antigen
MGETNQTTERRKTMMKRLALLCCILLLPTIAAAQSPEGNINYGDWWVGGQVGALFTTETNVTVSAPFFGSVNFNRGTEVGVTAGGIVGYNFCMPYRPAWQRYFGVALDFSWNQFNQARGDNSGNQFALAFLARAQYPLMGNEEFKFGRLVPFIMFGPAVVWTDSSFVNFGDSHTSTNFGIVAELGLEYFIIPHLSIGPSFRYRHVWQDSFDVRGVSIEPNGLNQFTLMARLAYHF